MRSNASVAGHPLHAILVAIPIGLWTFALVEDAAAYFVADPLPWKMVALYCIGGGIAGGVLAAITGLIDYAGIPSPHVKRVATFHMVINSIALALYAGSFFLRWRAPAVQEMAVPPVILSTAGFLLVGVGGWLGGELVYRLGVGVDEAKEGEPATRKRAQH
jgi:uncharacterized membrane protein